MPDPQEYHQPVEEYLETMLGLSEEGVPVIGARIAERLGRSAPSVSQMLDRLVEASTFAEQIVGHPLPGKVMHGGALGTYRTAHAA